MIKKVDYFYVSYLIPLMFGLFIGEYSRDLIIKYKSKYYSSHQVIYKSSPPEYTSSIVINNFLIARQHDYNSDESKCFSESF